MEQNNVQNRLDHAVYGTPKIKPEEQAMFLGTFRERCYVTMTIEQMKKTVNKQNFGKELSLHPQATTLLNGAMDSSLQANYIKLINEHNAKFTIINEHVTNNPETFGLILTASEAVDEVEIDIEKKYPQPVDNSDSPAKKQSLWKKLFS